MVRAIFQFKSNRDFLEQLITVDNKKPSNINQLYHIVESAWNKIPVDCCIHLINSMPRKCAEMIEKKDGPIKY